MKLTLYYAILSTRYGTDLLCGLSRDSYLGQLRTFVLTWTGDVEEPDEFVPDEAHADPTYLGALVRQGRTDEAIKWYFAHSSEDSLHEGTCEISLDPPGADGDASLKEALETARDYVFAAFQSLADRTDVPDHVVDALHGSYAEVRALEKRALWCPKNPTHDRFRATATVEEHWILNPGGHFVDNLKSAVQVLREPNLREDVITCAECGAEAVVGGAGRTLTT